MCCLSGEWPRAGLALSGSAPEGGGGGQDGHSAGGLGEAEAAVYKSAAEADGGTGAGDVGSSGYLISFVHFVSNWTV